MVESWTRIVSLKHDNLDDPHIHPLNMELIMANNLPRKIDD